MKISYLIALLFIITIYASCTRSKDGTYAVINISDSDNSINLVRCQSKKINGNSISSFLKQIYRGKKFDIKIKDNFAIVTDLEEGEDTILAQKIDNNGVYYSTEISKPNGIETFFVQLRPELKGGLALIVTLESKGTIQYLPAQVGGTVTKDGRDAIQCGRAICYLGKIN